MRAESVAPLVLGVCAAAAVWLLAPSVAWFDDGELSAAVATLGVPHPTGFPMLTLGGHTLLGSVFGSLALRVHLAGALVAALAAALLWASGPGSRRAHGWLGAVALPMLAGSVALHVRATEIYPWVWLHAAAVAFVWRREAGARRLSGLWALGGVAALIHAESALIAAGAAGVATATAPLARGDKLRAVLVGAGLALVAAVGLVALPLAAARDPGLSWGDVRTLPALLDHLTAASIRAAFAGRIGTGVPTSAAMLLRQLSADLGPLLWLAAPGAVALARRDRQSAQLWLGLLAADVGVALWLNPMGLRDAQVGQLTTLLLCQCAWLAVVEAVTWATGAPGRAATAVGLVVALGLVAWRGHTLTASHPNADLRAAADLTDRLFDTTPPGSLLIASSDFRAAACTWSQVAVGSRPDSRCVPLVFTRSPRMLAWLDRTGRLSAFSAAGAALRRAEGPKARAKALGLWVRAAVADGPVLWERGHGFEDAQVGTYLRPGYPWDTLRPGHARPGPNSERHAALERALEAAAAACAQAQVGPTAGGGDEERCPPGRPGSAVVGTWASLWGTWLLRHDDPMAGRFLATAVRWAPRSAPALNNLAVLLTRQGDVREALRLCERALEAQPDYVRAHRSAARAAVLAGDPEAATRHARAWLKRAPRERARAWLRSLSGQARDDDTRRALRALEVAP